VMFFAWIGGPSGISVSVGAASEPFRVSPPRKGVLPPGRVFHRGRRENNSPWGCIRAAQRLCELKDSLFDLAQSFLDLLELAGRHVTAFDRRMRSMNSSSAGVQT